MALLDSLKNLFKQGEGQVAAHKDQAHDAVKKVADEAEKRTGGKYGDQIDSAEQKANDAIDKIGETGAQGAHENQGGGTA
jgi:hypothetical protein